MSDQSGSGSDDGYNGPAGNVPVQPREEDREHGHGIFKEEEEADPGQGAEAGGEVEEEVGTMTEIRLVMA